jgi:RND superfamily putative drug exporter
VLIAWVLILAAAGGGALAFGKGFDNSVSIPGTESQEALEQLSATFPQVSGTSARIVVVAPEGGTVTDPAIVADIQTAVAELVDVDLVAGVTSPVAVEVDGVLESESSLSADERAGLITVQLESQSSTTPTEVKDEIKTITAHLQDALPTGAEAVVGGELFSTGFPALSIVEAVGLLVAMVVLVLTLGSFIAAGMPILTAILGVGITVAALFGATAVAKITSTTPMLALMLGLAVGIDYALFIIARHQELLKQGVPLHESIGRAVATAGSAVVFAGITVIIALVGLFVANIPFLTTMGIAAAVGVAIAVLMSLTLVPAMLGFAKFGVLGKKARASLSHSEAEAEGPSTRSLRAPAQGPDVPVAERPSSRSARSGTAQRVEAHTDQHAEPKKSRADRFFGGWVRAVTRWPIVTIVIIVAGLGALALPASQLRLALPDAGALPESNSARVAYDLVSEHFGEGFNGPLIVTGTIVESTDPLGLMDDLADELRALPGVADVPLATPNATADTGIIQVIPESGPDSIATEDLVHEIRSMHQYFLDEYNVDLAVTGFTAVGIDVSERLGGALLPFGILVVGLSLVLLTIVFRSIAVPIKASLGYLLSVVAAFGVVSLVFEHGFLADLLHVERVGPVISFMPIILMGILFGLAMDYEVFLVSRMREEWVHGSGEPRARARRAVRDGFVGSAKVVAAAGLIMVSVFVAFVPEGDANLKPIALGLAVGIFVDAFIVRMALVPAVMQLLGARAWWLPAWLERILPTFDVEGEAISRERALADWPSPDSTAAVVVDGLEVAVDGGATLLHDVSVSAEPGSAILAVGDGDRRPGTALLLALTGRLRPTGGRAKVLGLAVPERGSAVRGRTAYVDLLGEPRPVRAVRRELAGRPAVIAIDGADLVDSPADRAAITELIGSAMAATGRRQPITVVLGALDAVAAADLLPAVPTAIVDLPPVSDGSPYSRRALPASAGKL